MGKSWETTFTELCEIALAFKAMPNDKKVYAKYLEKYFDKRPQLKNAFGKKLTGKEFCKYLEENEIRCAIAHIGSHHIVAVIDYKIHDTWDCTNWCVGNFWA
jgi:hypothetical protein